MASLTSFILLLSTFELLRFAACISQAKLDFEDAALHPLVDFDPALKRTGEEAQRVPARKFVQLRGAPAYDAEYEEEAAAIDAELALSERLIVNAWDIVRRAPLPGVADIARPQVSVADRLRKLVQSASAAEWYFFLVALAIMISVDVAILQHLPEIERTHLGLFIFWLLIAAAFCTEVWLRLGEEAGISWAAGYLIELIYSMELIFVFNLIFHVMETPRRLMRKALFVSMLGAIVLKLAFHLGLAEAMYGIVVVPYLLGAWLIYCGTQQLAHSLPGEDMRDVTQTVVVRILRKVLGKRLGEFYDEQGEAIFMHSSQRLRVTLLGVVVLSLLLAVFCFSPDATLAKLSVIPNGYVSFSSSVLGLLTLRALFFVVKDILTHFSCARYGTGIIFFFVGAEMVIARFTEVSAMMSLIVVINVIMFMAVLSALKDSACSKIVS